MKPTTKIARRGMIRFVLTIFLLALLLAALYLFLWPPGEVSSLRVDRAETGFSGRPSVTMTGALV